MQLYTMLEDVRCFGRKGVSKGCDFKYFVYEEGVI